MDVHALGSSLGDRREGISSCHKPLYPTRGQWLPYRGRDEVKTTFLPLPFALSKRLWVQTPRPVKKLTHIFKRSIIFHSNQISFLIFLWCSFCLTRQLETFFLSSFFFFNLMAKITRSHQVFLSFFTNQYTKL